MFHYCIVLLLTVAGRARLVETVPGENGLVFTFESLAGERLTLARPAMTAEQEATVKKMLGVILAEGDWL